jgi:hypothetical protein
LLEPTVVVKLANNVWSIKKHDPFFTCKNKTHRTVECHQLLICNSSVSNSLVEIRYVNIGKTNKATHKQQFSLIGEWDTDDLRTGS